MGAQMIKAVASKTHDHAGDGTTTAPVPAQALVREGMKSVSAGVDPMALKRGIDLAVTAVVTALTARSKPVDNNNSNATAGLVRTNSDERCRLKIARAHAKVGQKDVQHNETDTR